MPCSAKFVVIRVEFIKLASSIIKLMVQVFKLLENEIHSSKSGLSRSGFAKPKLPLLHCQPGGGDPEKA